MQPVSRNESDRSGRCSAPRYTGVVAAPFGPLAVVVMAGVPRQVDIQPDMDALPTFAEAASEYACRLIARYLQDPRTPLDVPVAIDGTPFQCRVWEQLRSIPAGLTRTYGELATRMHSSPRAVGAACRRNPVPIVVPCHRVVARGHAGGFMGCTSGTAVEIKAWLLAHEADAGHAPRLL